MPAEMNYYAALAAANCGEIQAVGAGIGGGFEHTYELKVMKYEEAISSPDKEGWKAEIKNEHRRMQKHGVWKSMNLVFALSEFLFTAFHTPYFCICLCSFSISA